MNFGIGLSAFTHGLNQGLDAGKKINGLVQEGQIRGVTSDAVKQAETERAGAIQSLIKTGSSASADGSMTTPTYSVDGAQYGDMGAATKAAESKAPSMDDFYVKSVVPKISAAYMKQGNLEQAEKWNAWAKEKNTQAGMKHWTNALRAGQMGDYKSYADNMVKAYNTPGYYDDGMEADGYELVKDKEGNTTGMTLNLKNKSTGEKFSQTINGQKDMVQRGIGLLDPANAFKTTQANVMAADAAGVKAAEGDLKFKREVYRDDRKGERQERMQANKEESAIDRLVTGKEIDARNKRDEIKMKAEVEWFYKNGTDQEEAVKQIFLGLQKTNSDPLAANKKSNNELLAEARSVVDSIYSQQKPANPMSGGIGLPGAEGAPAKGVPMVYDSQTVQMVPYKR